MRKQITHIAPLQMAKVFALLCFVISLPFCVLGFVSLQFLPQASIVTPMALIGIPFLYAIFGFFFTFLAAYLYNFVAKYTGGIEYTSIDLPGA